MSLLASCFLKKFCDFINYFMKICSPITLGLRDFFLQKIKKLLFFSYIIYLLSRLYSVCLNSVCHNSCDFRLHSFKLAQLFIYLVTVIAIASVLAAFYIYITKEKLLLEYYLLFFFCCCCCCWFNLFFCNILYNIWMIWQI